MSRIKFAKDLQTEMEAFFGVENIDKFHYWLSKEKVFFSMDVKISMFEKSEALLDRVDFDFININKPTSCSPEIFEITFICIYEEAVEKLFQDESIQVK